MTDGLDMHPDGCRCKVHAAEPTEAERLLGALHGVTWEGEPVSAVVERLITQAQRDALTEAADALCDDPTGSDKPESTRRAFTAWLRQRAGAL